MSMRDRLRKKMYDHLATAFPAEYGSTLPIFYENQGFEAPNNSPYLMVYFKFTDSKPASLGSTKRFRRHTGYFIVDCVVPKDSGTSAIWQMADAVDIIFDNRQFTLEEQSYLTITTPKIMREYTLDGKYIVPVMVPFILDGAPIG